MYVALCAHNGRLLYTEKVLQCCSIDLYLTWLTMEQERDKHMKAQVIYSQLSHVALNGNATQTQYDILISSHNLLHKHFQPNHLKVVVSWYRVFNECETISLQSAVTILTTFVPLVSNTIIRLSSNKYTVTQVNWLHFVRN